MTKRRALAAVVGAAVFAADAPALAAVDLSRYVRVGQYDLPTPIALEASAVTYDAATDSLFIVDDEATSVVRVSKTGALLDSMTLAPGAFEDTEGITALGNGQLVLAEERVRQLDRFTYTPGATMTRAQVQSAKLGTTIGNEGFEGVSADAFSGGFVIVKEINPQGVFQTTVDWSAGTASNGSPTTVNSANLFDPASLALLDVADVHAQADAELLILSQESGKLVNATRAGAVTSSLDVGTAAEGHEGVTLGPDGRIYVVNEGGGGANRPQLWVYAPSGQGGTNQPPTAVTLANPIASVSSTGARVKVADILVSDDALGTNTLSLVGADAALFEIEGTTLYLKAGTPLDRGSFSVAVTVDDVTVGATPDATSATLTLPVSTLAVTEAAPWSSGDSPVGADWFEVTNRGTTPVDLTGWKVDDSSDAFATAVALNGVGVIAPGESVLFVEGTAAKAAELRAHWALLAGVQIGFYSGAGIGLSIGGDAVNLFNPAGTRITGFSFGPATTGITFENVNGVELSVAGVNGAFTRDGETGSPGRIAAPDSEVETPGTIVGTVAPQLSLTLGLPAVFAPFTAGVAREYTAATTVTVTSTAGEATLSTSDAGRMTNGAYALAQPLVVTLSKTAWTAPVSSDVVDVALEQSIGAHDPLRTGGYSKTITFTLSTTNP